MPLWAHMKMVIVCVLMLKDVHLILVKPKLLCKLSSDAGDGLVGGLAITSGYT